MPIPRRYTTDAIVLSRFDLGEADRVLTLITPAGGKLKAVAKGVRRPTSRLGERLETAAEPLYGLLRRAYELLDAEMAPGRVARWYEMHLLDELGVRPEVDRCVECDRMLEADERFRWVPPLGGVVCERCPGPPHDRTRLSLEALKLVKAYQRLDIEALAELRLAPAVEREVEVALREFVRDVLEREARSLAFLDEVRHVPVPG